MSHATSGSTREALDGAPVPAVHPLIAVDEVEVRSDHEVVAVKRVVASDPYLSGHYPGQPIYPGVFVVESARQAVAELIRRTRGDGYAVILLGLPAVRFTAPLLAGDSLRLHAQCGPDGDGTAFTATVSATGPGAQPVAQLRLRYAVAEPAGVS